MKLLHASVKVRAPALPAGVFFLVSAFAASLTFATITTMFTTDREVERCLTLLRNLIRQKEFTQLDVQQALGWGRSYISQLLTKQKALRYEQMLLVLNVIGVSPEEFFAELFPALQHAAPTASTRGAPIRQPVGAQPVTEAPAEEIRSLYGELRGLLGLLHDKGYMSTDELAEAVQRAETGPEGRS